MLLANGLLGGTLLLIPPFVFLMIFVAYPRAMVMRHGFVMFAGLLALAAYLVSGYSVDVLRDRKSVV